MTASSPLKLGDDIIINEGQHRAAGIAAALKENPALGEHTISVLLFPYEDKDRVQQMFSDLNRFVQKTSKSLDILYDKRDPARRSHRRHAKAGLRKGSRPGQARAC